MYSILQVAVIAETSLEQGSRAEARYLARGESGLPRGLVIDFKDKRFFILSKKYGKFQASGAYKKVDDVVSVHIKEAAATGEQFQAEARHFVRLTNKKGMALKKAELDIELEVANDVRVIVDYTKTTKSGTRALKTVVIQEAYDHDLSPYVQAKPTDTKMLQIFLCLGKKMAVLHKKGFVHGDLKSANALVRTLPGGTLDVKISDFGLTYNPSRGNPRKVPVPLYGSPLYTAPELLGLTGTAPPHSDPTTQGQAEDMFALGCLMYEILFSKPIPWRAIGFSAYHLQKGNKVAADRYLPHALTELNDYRQQLTNEAQRLPSSFRKEFLGICARLLDSDPQRRPTAVEYERLMERLTI